MTYSTGTTAIHSLQSQATLAITDGSLSIAVASQSVGLSVSADETHFGTFGGSGTLTIPSGGSFTWTGGEIRDDGVTNISPGATLLIDGSEAKSFRERTLNLAGSGVWRGSGAINAATSTLNILDGASFDVQGDLGYLFGTINVAPTAVLRKSVGTGNAQLFIVVLTNHGLVEVLQGTLDLSTSGTSDGRFNVSAGTTLQFSTGTSTLSPQSSVSGSGNVHFPNGLWNIGGTYAIGGTTTIDGGTANFNSATALATTLLLTSLPSGRSGTLGGSGTLTIPSGGTFTWTGGLMRDDGVTNISPGATLLADGSEIKSLAARTLNLAGSGVWRSIGNISGSTSTLNILDGATFDVQGDLAYLFGTINIAPSGVLRKSVGSGTAQLFIVDLTNHGLVEVLQGTLDLSTSGTSDGRFSVPAGTTLQLSTGTSTFTPTSSVSGSGDVHFAGGLWHVGGAYAIGGTTTIDGGTANFNSVSAQTSALLLTSLPSGRTGVLGGTGTMTIPAGGTFTWSGGDMQGEGVTNISPSATMLISGDAAKRLAARTLNNAGTITWTGTGALSAVSLATLNNLSGGVVDIQSDAGADTDGWFINNQAGATFKKTAGVGTTRIGAAFTNAGTLLPGGSPGVGMLALSFTYTQTSTGHITIALTGAPICPSASIFAIGGAATLAGTLDITTPDGCQPNSAVIYRLLSFASRTGTFATVTNTPTGFQVIHSPTDITLSAKTPVAIVYNTAPTAPEIQAIAGYVDELGFSRTLFDQNVTFNELRPFQLVIWDDESFQSGGLTNANVDTFKQVYDAGIPLYFIGDDLAFSNVNLDAARQATWQGLTHLGNGGNLGGNGTVTIVDATHPVTNGPFGAVASYAYGLDIDDAHRTNTGEVLLATSGPDDVLLAFQDNSFCSRTVTQNALAFTSVGSPNEGKKLFKNAVSWLLQRCSLASCMTITTSTVGRDNSRLIGPWPSLLQPYLSRADSPLDLSGLGSTSYLEDFERHALTVPGVHADHGGPASITFGPGLHDSVDADDGVIDGSGLAGDDWFFSPGSDGVTWTFDATVLGGLPTCVGVVWTDGTGLTTFEAFDANGASLGTVTANIADNSVNGTTADDRFFGVVYHKGVKAVRLSNTGGGIELDHLQYAGFNSAGPTPTPTGTPATSTPTPTLTSTATPSPTPTVTPTVTPTPSGNAPVATLDAPADGSQITTRTDIVGTASSSTLASWILAYRVAGSASLYTILATSTTPVTSGTLGTFDPSLLLNGMYELRLDVTDVAGRTSTAFSSVVVQGENKIGTFGLQYTDLNVQLVGLPIRVQRSYDSRDSRTGDFGVGWTLGLSNVRVQENRPLGTAWAGTRSVVTFCIAPAANHVVSITLPDDSVYQFEPTITPNCQGLQPITDVTIGFRQLAGGTGLPGARLESLDVHSALVVGCCPGDVELVDFDSGIPVDPNRYRLTLPDGRALVLDQQLGLQSLTDLNGNVLTVSSAGITHSSGSGISFTRDAAGRITRATDPLGQFLTYSYNPAGDLVVVTDQVAQTTTYAYDGRHHLLSITDPLGRQPVRYTYDVDGRVIAVTDADGHDLAVSRNPGAQQEVVTDRLGHSSVLEYNARGDVVRRTDALSHSTTLAYDARGNRLNETDPLGNVRSYTYDAFDNRLTETDPLGHTTSFTFSSRNRPLTSTDARGAQEVITYDANANALTATDPLGKIYTFTYDARGNLLTRTDPLGATWTYVYDAAGRQTRSTNPLGTPTDRVYDANGNLLSETTTRQVNGAPQTVSTSYQYDGRNRQVRATDPEGGVSTTAYTTTGAVSSRTDPLGHTTSYTFDNQDRLTTITYPDGTSERPSYDVEGRTTAFVDQAGRATTFAYDAAGRQVTVTHPDGSVELLGYDIANRRTTLTDERAGVATNVYDAAGHVLSVRDPLGGTTSFTYDATGNMVTRTDANGRTTTSNLDLAGRLASTRFADGTTASNSYDALGRRTASVDQAGHTTSYAYDALGNLTGVTDPLGGQTRYAYDALRHRVSQTDPLNNTTRLATDRIGRETGRTLPLGQTATRTYDAVGNLISLRDFNGQTSTYTYDALDRLTGRALPDGEVDAFSYTATARLASMADAHGTTSFTYDQRDRPTLVRQPDGSGVGFGYDLHGNRTSVTTPAGTTTLGYDADNRLTRVTDPLAAVTTLARDPRGNQTGVSYPNGILATYSYDALDRVTGIVQTKGATTLRSYEYTLGPVGNRTSVVENSGRQVDYAYDALFRLTREQVTAAGGGTASATDYTYDQDGNRLTRADTSGTTNYAYDANSRVLSAGATTYGYDANGNLTSQTDGGGTTAYNYDALNRLRQVTPSAGAPTNFAYDALGNRTRAVAAGGTTNFLVDPFGQNGTRLAVERAGGSCCARAGGPRLPYGALAVPGRVDLAQVLRETDGSGAALTDYTYAGRLLLEQRQAGSLSVFLPDGQRATRALADASGEITDSYDYDAFGTLVAHTGNTVNRYLFDGQQFDADQGRYYLRARQYDPSLGRFTARDPLAGQLTRPATLNPYVYAANNPLMYDDPSGEDFSMIELGVASAIVGSMTAAFTLGFTGSVAKATLAGTIAFSATFVAGVAGIYGFALLGSGGGVGVLGGGSGAALVGGGGSSALLLAQSNPNLLDEGEELVENGPATMQMFQQLFNRLYALYNQGGNVSTQRLYDFMQTTVGNPQDELIPCMVLIGLQTSGMLEGAAEADPFFASTLAAAAREILQNSGLPPCAGVTR